LINYLTLKKIPGGIKMMDCDTILLIALFLVVIFLVFLTMYKKEGDEGEDVQEEDEIPRKYTPRKYTPPAAPKPAELTQPPQISTTGAPITTVPATQPSILTIIGPRGFYCTDVNNCYSATSIGPPALGVSANIFVPATQPSIFTIIGPRGFYCTDVNNCYSATSIIGPPAPGVSANIFVPPPNVFTATQTAYFSNLISGCTKSTQPIFNLQNPDALSCDQSLYKILYP
jgi:hypothetical protein